MCHDIYVNSRVTPSLQECDLDIILKTTSAFSVWKQPCTWTPGMKKQCQMACSSITILCALIRRPQEVRRILYYAREIAHTHPAQSHTPPLPQRCPRQPTGGQGIPVLHQRNRSLSPFALPSPTPHANQRVPAHRWSGEFCITPEKLLTVTLRTPIPHPSRKLARELHVPPPLPINPYASAQSYPTILASSHPLSPSTHSSCPLPPYYHPNSHINLPFTKDCFGEQKNGRTSNMLA